MVQEEVLKPVCMRESINRKRIQRKKRDMNLHLIACWAQKAANWQDTFRGWTHTQKQIFSFKEDVCHLHLLHGFRPKSIWHEENLIWLFIQIILPALIATLLPRGNHGQRETQGAMLLRPWIEAGSEYSGSRTPDWSDLSLMQRIESVEQRQPCKCTRIIAYLTKFYSHHQYIL